MKSILSIFYYLLAGDNDYLKEENLALLDAYVNPVVVRHPEAHKVPRLG